VSLMSQGREAESRQGWPRGQGTMCDQNIGIKFKNQGKVNISESKIHGIDE
jgi:hypothetical protein